MAAQLQSLAFSRSGQRVARQERQIEVGSGRFSLSASAVSGVIVDDCSNALAVGKRGVERRRQVDEECLVSFLRRVAADQDRDAGGFLARSEINCPAGGVIVAPA